ncbi:NAD(P)/FAD-dependent oxidoreductase [Chitinophaga silvisoli]|uniref:NAD(P)/FAD-dependent oxidoreductase n=1 Tax=Chitinophaga silvisoli TaxID=2291814 RepID=A0A3E1NZ64_9BACT|nr:NAD(P)/FAD-dependent oxidoreductase [Chitinophaga silvisoli]RFM33236.1 NAD(P)/FAD-dependent oxidoreductase [Chitinophaga silvisoli]
MEFEVIIVGGSYAGLQAGMTLGRALRKVLIIDSGKPCNAQTPHSHNFLTRDGETPAAITTVALEQLKTYNTVQLLRGKAIKGEKTGHGFAITTEAGERFTAKKLIITTGIKDLVPDIPGVAACWGISVIHCPYCHGYEVAHQPTGILGNGDGGFETVKLIRHWTKDLTLFTNGPLAMSEEMVAQIKRKNIRIIETPVKAIIHEKGQLSAVELADGTKVPLKAVYARLPFIQHSDIPAQLGCEFTETGHIKIADFGKTSVEGVYAAGDNCSMMRGVANAVSAGLAAAAFVNRELIWEEFEQV